jgi:hypothetical protein
MAINIRFIGFIVLAVIVAVGIWMVVGRNEVAAPEGPTAETPSPSPAGSPPPAAPTPGTTGQPSPSPSPVSAPASGFSFAVPMAGNVWAMNTKHVIAWNREGGVQGELRLFDETTGKAVGWIVPFTDAKQTSYLWDTRDVAVDRTGGTRKNVAPGAYSLRLTLPGKGEVKSGAFTIGAEGVPETATQVVRMRDTRLSPTAFDIARGGTVVFVNNETKAQTITGDGLPSTKVGANGGIATLNTASLSPRTYFYITDLYTYQSQGTITVK